MQPAQTSEQRFERFRRTGDLAALTQLFDEIAPELLPLALRLAGTRHDAEDLVQETFLVALEKNADYDATRPLRPWLVGILVREARRLRRNLAREIRRLDLDVPPDGHVETRGRAFNPPAFGDVAKMEKKRLGYIGDRVSDPKYQNEWYDRE